MGCPEDEEERDHDLRVLINYNPQTSILCMGTQVETGLPLPAHGWVLAHLNSLNMLGSGNVCKVCFSQNQTQKRMRY